MSNMPNSREICITDLHVSTRYAAEISGENSHVLGTWLQDFCYFVRTKKEEMGNKIFS